MIGTTEVVPLQGSAELLQQLLAALPPPGSEVTNMQNNGANRSNPLLSLFGGLLRSPLPTLGCEISHDGISVARWSRGAGTLGAAAWKPLPEGAMEASPLRDNLLLPEEVRRVGAEALRSLGISEPGASHRSTDAVLIIPDQAARLFVLDFENFPSRPAEGLSLVKWRLKKSLPFDVDSASISYFVQRLGNERQVVAVATPQWIVRQYEMVAQQLGLRPRWVVLSTLAVLPLADNVSGAAPGGTNGAAGILVAKYSPPWFTTAILQGGMLRLFRTTPLPAAGGLPAAADVLASIYPSIAYFQDNFHGTVERACLCGLGESTHSIQALLVNELSLRSAPLSAQFGGAISGADAGGADRHFAALLGIAREQLNG